MTTLHIEHSVTDFAMWQQAFDRFAEARRTAGVLRHTVRRPVDDDCYVSIDLEFDSVDRAESFLGFLRSRVWAVPDNSPALIGSPSVRILNMA